MKDKKEDKLDTKLFEKPMDKVYNLFAEFLFVEFLRSSLKDGKPSETLLDISKELHKISQKKEIKMGEKNITELLDELMKTKGEKLLKEWKT
jgi:hypothetical protein